jgi:hypothetical protein
MRITVVVGSRTVGVGSKLEEHVCVLFVNYSTDRRS